MKLPMTGFELQVSGVESDRSTNYATTPPLPIHPTIVIYNSKVVGRQGNFSSEVKL